MIATIGNDGKKFVFHNEKVWSEFNVSIICISFKKKSQDVSVLFSGT